MRLKQIKWRTSYGKPKNRSLVAFELIGEFPGLLEGRTEAFYISNKVPYDSYRVSINHVYLSRSIPNKQYRFNNVSTTYILKFNTIKEAKERAQEICFKLITEKFFVKDKRLSRKVMLEKFNGKNHTRRIKGYRRIVQRDVEEELPF